MCVIDVDAKYNNRPVRFYGGISSALMAMTNQKSGAVKNDWIVEVWYV